MSTVSEKSKQLYELMLRKGYPEDFSALIAGEMRTEFTASRMIGYINKTDRLPLEEVADEMFAILSDRDRITEKHLMEHAQAKINEMYREQYEREKEDERHKQ